MSHVMDLIKIGRLSIFDILNKMKENNDDLNKIQFDYEITKEIKKLQGELNFQYCIGRISALRELKEMIKMGENLNSKNFEEMIKKNILDLEDEEIVQEATELTSLKKLSNDSIYGDSNLLNKAYSTSQIITDFNKCESLLDSLLRKKCENQELLSDEFAKEFDEAEKTRLNENPKIINHEFDDPIEFMKLDTKLYILNQKKIEWNEIPKHIFDAFFQIKTIQNLSANQKNEHLGKDLSLDTKLLGKLYCRKIINFFENSNF